MSKIGIRRADKRLHDTIVEYFGSIREAIESSMLKYVNIPAGRNALGESKNPARPISVPIHNIDFSYFTGVYIGDGGYHKGVRGRTSVYCYGFDVEMISRFANIGEQSFGIIPKIYITVPDRNQRTEHGDVFHKVAFNSREMTRYMVDMVGDPKAIPDWIKYGSLEIKSGFIRGFADAEGTAYNIRSTGYVKLAQKDRSILEDVQTMLKEIGIRSSIGINKQGCHILCISGSMDVVKYRDTIGFGITRKQEKLSRVVVTKESILNTLRYRGIMGMTTC
jgi:intein/homing endonuclease